MKKNLYILLTGLFTLTACAKNLLDKEPLDVVSDAVVWNDQVLIDAYLTNVYLQMPILTNECAYTRHQDFHHGETWNGPFVINEISDESKRNWIYGAPININC